MRIARLLPAELDLKQTARDVELLARLLDTGDYLFPRPFALGD